MTVNDEGDYEFAVPTIKGYTVGVIVLINGAEYAAEIVAGKVTIPGESIVGDIHVHFTKTPDNQCVDGQHVFEEPVYRWSADNTTCKASRVCTCGEKTEKEIAISTSIDGEKEKIYIAVFQNPAFLTQVKTVKLSDTEKGEDIEVSFRLIGDSLHDDAEEHEQYVTWIPTEIYTVGKGTTALEVLIQALTEQDMGYNNKNNFVNEIQAPEVLGGFWLSNGDNGSLSGWMYTINGSHPQVTMTSYELEDGDEIVVHYCDDFTQEEHEGAPYYQRWLEALDISPKAYVRSILNKIVTIEGEGEVKPELKSSHIGKNVKFTFTPAENWKIKAVYVDGKDMGAIEAYTYKALTLNTRIKVVFAQDGALQMNFKDVSEADWFYEDVYFVASNGLFNGTDEYTFSPDAPMTRTMLVTVLYRLEGQPPAYGRSSFSDVRADQWYSDAVVWATNVGVVEGYSNGLFGTNDNVTREQMAAILYRYAKYKGYDISDSNSLVAYSDYKEISAYALKALQWSNAEGLITGRGNGILAPTGTATRAEVAAIFHRFVENVVL